MRSIVLTGFMGTGKTEVGKRLAAKLGRPFIDTDLLIEEREGMTIADIFARKGEQYFRAVEKEVVAQACRAREAVIATGGGAIVDDENYQRMRESGSIFCLTASPEVILSRVGKNRERPLLERGDPLERIQSLLRERASAYARADHTIDTSNLSVEEVVKGLLDF